MEQNYNESESKSYCSRVSEIPLEVRLEAIKLFTPHASEALKAELLEFMDKRIHNIHCVVLAGYIEEIASILKKHNTTTVCKSSSAIIINQFGNIRTVL